MSENIISVGQLNLYVKSLLEGDSRLAYINICGEISNFKAHFSSGHLYFTLKDNTGSLKCVMFRGNASKLRFIPADGMRVVCSGRISVYERDGVYQLYAENMKPEGEGDLMAELEKIKEKLSAEGLFDAERKKALPAFPKKIAVITSQSGAAVRDIMNVLSRRYPLCNVLLCPASVQGALAAESLISALEKVSLSDAELVIIGRGGGSIEDLWCFNDEKLARRIASMKVPVISAVGHETDFTICDFVADLRAPTPSAAAELAVPDMEELYALVMGMRNLISNCAEKKLIGYEKSLALIMSSATFSSPVSAVCEKRALMLDSVTDRIKARTEKNIDLKKSEFCTLAAKLEALSPINTMLRGYGVVLKNNCVIKSVDSLEVGESITLQLADGKAECRTEKILKEQ